MSENLMDRRDFMKSSVTGMSGYVLLSSAEKKEEGKQTGQKFIYRTLGKTGMKIPIVSMGMAQSSNPSLVRAALDAGIIHFDSGNEYQMGRNESMLGEVMKGRPRESFILSTKVKSPRDRITGLYTPQATGAEFLKKFNTSLERLKLEYVDILYHHEVSRKESASYEPIMQAMEKVKKEGKVRFLGITTHANEPEVIQAATDSNFYEVVLTSYNFKQKHYLQVREAISKASNAGLGVVAMKAMGGLWQDVLKPVNASAALKWVLQDPNIHTAVPGFNTFEEMKTDLAVMENLALTDSEKKDLEKAASIPGLYCQGCGQCLKQCFAKLPIPDLMRAYMYVYGHRNLAHAQGTILALDLPRSVCADCGKCSVQCSVGFDVPAKVRDIVRLRDVPPEFLA